MLFALFLKAASRGYHIGLLLRNIGGYHHSDTDIVLLFKYNWLIDRPNDYLYNLLQNEPVFALDVIIDPTHCVHKASHVASRFIQDFCNFIVTENIFSLYKCKIFLSWSPSTLGRSLFLHFFIKLILKKLQKNDTLMRHPVYVISEWCWIKKYLLSQIP